MSSDTSDTAAFPPKLFPRFSIVSMSGLFLLTWREQSRHYTLVTGRFRLHDKPTGRRLFDGRLGLTPAVAACRGVSSAGNQPALEHVGAGLGQLKLHGSFHNAVAVERQAPATA